ncbi:poly [ADP-ribose] polymerase [Plakobranchus ocellatus]|uniref:Poly [ADP-ribose] polymerase n=1 Tax=Plakobranchus ocellatus TaxID=259542 RepID=A0AAV4DPY6_9GAST|nr:poly [ADP-ribose] polymerase [Plakobranchus ocellatus]
MRVPGRQDITCVSARDSEKLTTPASFLLFLKQRQILARDNVLLLQAMLRCLKREDLLEIVDNYAGKIGNTLYWYKAPDEPANGFIHARFYVDGNLESFQRQKLEKLREYVARLLGVPKEFIFLVGVEEGSVILTFMISEQYADQLKDLFEKHKDGFRQFGVDGIRVVDPPTVDEQSLDPRAEREENKEDFSTREYYSAFHYLLNSTGVALKPCNESDIKRLFFLMIGLKQFEKFW